MINSGIQYKDKIKILELRIIEHKISISCKPKFGEINLIYILNLFICNEILKKKQLEYCDLFILKVKRVFIFIFLWFF